MNFLQRLFRRAKPEETRPEEPPPCKDEECCRMKQEDADRLARDKEEQSRMWEETQSIREAAERYGDDGARRRYLVEIERDVIQRRKHT